ncbi:hypothetical protein MNBD_GAMMA06-1144 [hydrothermal vent metagenome]|uniref:Uncharacterized protein n=1 Tax=hydrothermal vent metagenome TaxID=652676 RepID=A0A3B0X9F5_9ZZZZ
MLILSRTSRKQQSGFTLVEIAVVLVIVGFLVGSFVGTFAERIDTTRRDNTKKELDEIKKILKAYAYSQASVPYLPCPDISVPPDGLEDRTLGVCDAGTATGLLPYATLGIGNGDAWGVRYEYWVDSNYSVSTGFVLTEPATGNATINTRVGDAIRTIANNAAAVIFSHGKNSLGGISIDDINQPVIPALGNGYDDEFENMNVNVPIPLFISRSPSEVGSAALGGAFDDIVVWIGSFELKAAMVETGLLP